MSVPNVTLIKFYRGSAKLQYRTGDAPPMPPATPTAILTEASDEIITESGDTMVTE